jgi:predicted transcriptional regulator
MKANDIRAELVRRNISMVSVARSIGVSQPAVSQIISGKKTSSRIRQAIAKAIGKPVDEVFPEPVTEEAA